ncbi:MAG: hypothetical protein AMJ53_06030 [Gammaproteobacteria bacterium SG8_11]|nr:MAG: hypothetical protein AMJ53_06030 [Gammaproteobacteria bacterium SG8_11]
MAEYLEYDGHELHWRNPRDGQPAASYKTTSGLITTSQDYQNTTYQCTPEMGPIPNGNYKLKLWIDPNPAQDDGTGRCALKPSWKIQTIPRGATAGSCEPFWANWGNKRVRFKPADDATRNRCSPRRGGFYLHDSTKGFSHGCIEVEPVFFFRLSNYAGRGISNELSLKVNYVYSDTYGGTFVPTP